MCVSMYEYVHVSAEACGGQMLGFPSGARITGVCEAPKMGAGNQTWVFSKSSMTLNCGDISLSCLLVYKVLGQLARWLVGKDTCPQA